MAAPAMAQCSMCQATLVGSAEGRAMAGAFNHAILVMLVAPYLVFVSLLFVFFRHRIPSPGRVWGRLRRLATAR
jgi:hypothetical protein